MKRIIFRAGFCLFVFAYPAFGQLTSLGGVLEYRHEYSDVLTGDRLSTGLTRSPILNIHATGDVLDPNLARFSLSTNLNASRSDAHSGGIDYVSKGYSWDYYNLALNFLPLLPVRFDVSTRAGVNGWGSELYSGYSYFARSRRDEQTYSAYTQRIKWLPTAQFSFRRTHTSADESGSADVLDRRYSFSLSTGNGVSSIAMFGGMSDIESGIAQIRNRIYDLSIEAFRGYSEKSRLEVSAQYNRYDDYGTLSAAVSYGNSEMEHLTSSTSLIANNTVSGSFRSFSTGATESVLFAPEGNFQYGLNFSGRGGREVFYGSGGAVRNPTYEYTGSASVSHNRGVEGINLTNSLSFNYSRQKLLDLFTRFGAGISNGVNSHALGFDLFARHSISSGVQYNAERTTNVSNVADFTANGRLWQRIISTTGANYRDDRYTGDGTQYRNYRLFVVRQSFRTSYYYWIPFSIELSGSANWYLTGISGRTYGWNFLFQSGSFFVRGLGFDYRYSRSYDPYYLFEVVNQSARMTYRWRTVSLEMRLSQFNTLDRRREVWFSIIRPF